MRIVFSIVESASAQLKNAQLNFCKAQDIISYTKASITSERNDARFDSAWSGILNDTVANDVVDDPEFQDHEKFSDRLMNLQMPSFMQRPKIIIDSYITKCWTP